MLFDYPFTYRSGNRGLSSFACVKLYEKKLVFRYSHQTALIQFHSLQSNVYERDQERQKTRTKATGGKKKTNNNNIITTPVFSKS